MQPPMSVFAALADPTRRRIVELVADRERSVGEIVGHFDITQPAISRHLRVLRDAGIVSFSGDGQRRMYRVELGALDALEDWAERRRRAWSQRLDALEAHLKRHSGGARRRRR